jgi:hypothetical protein
LELRRHFHELRAQYRVRRNVSREAGQPCLAACATLGCATGDNRRREAPAEFLVSR